MCDTFAQRHVFCHGYCATSQVSLDLFEVYIYGFRWSDVLYCMESCVYSQYYLFFSTGLMYSTAVYILSTICFSYLICVLSVFIIYCHTYTRVAHVSLVSIGCHASRESLTQKKNKKKIVVHLSVRVSDTSMCRSSLTEK